MANEITVSVRLRVVNASGVVYFDRSLSNKQFDQTAIGGPTPGYLTIGTSEESQTFDELTTEGWLIMENMDTTNYVQWGGSTGVYTGRMGPGEPAIFNCEPGLTLYMKANTAACKVAVYCMES
jgi:hypothetical protein